MSEPFQPDPGDTVEFYNNEAELWEPGTVFSHSADRRTYFVQPDSENLPMYGVYYTNVRPVSATDDTAPESSNGDTPSFWEAAKTYARSYKIAIDWYKAADDRAEKAEGMARMHRERQDSIADERDNWMCQAIVNKERGDRYKVQAFEATKRADEAEVELKEMTEYAEEVRSRSEENYLRAVKAENHRDEYKRRVVELDASTYEWKARAERAETTLEDIARILVPRHELDAAEVRIEELEDQVRVLKSERETVAENAVRWHEHSRKISVVLAGHQAETWTDHDGTVRPLGAISRADLARQLYDENERAGQERARADKAETELAELKAALRTLAGDSE